MQEEDESKNESSEINPDALDEVFGDDAVIVEEEEEIIIKKVKKFNDEDSVDEDDYDDIDLAFHANDEKYW